MKNVIVIMLALLSISCASQRVYLTPAVKGQLFDGATKQPILEKGWIFTLLNKDGSNVAVTDKSVFFYVEAYKAKSISEPAYRAVPREINFNVDGYELKSLNYANFPFYPSSGGRDIKKEVDIGKVYLEPKK